MPLNTQIIRNNQPLPIRWGGFHLAAMTLAAAFDSGDGPFKGPNNPRSVARANHWGPAERRMARRYPLEPFPVSRSMIWSLTSYPVIGATPLNDGSYALRSVHSFVDLADGEILDLLPGDVLTAYRSS